MKKRVFFAALILLLLSLSSLSQEKKASKDLPEKYRKWLEEEVAYIITPREKDVFLQLASDRERDTFIEAFWKQRDPTPGTPQNEFKQEHYRRIAYANRIFGRGTPRPGWRTDMGRIYIILGEPINIERYEGFSFVYPTQIWYYQGDQRYGLPPFFNVVFFKKKGSGEYKLYSPMTDGMRELIIDKKIAGGDAEYVYEQLYQYDAKLAQASLSLIPGETPLPDNPSISSEFLLANIASLPRKKVEDEYAEKLLKYKDVVEVDYTANYIHNDHLVSLIQDEQGVFYVNFSIEPDSLSVDHYEDKYIAHFELNGNVTDSDGKTIFQYGKTFPLELTEEKLQQLQRSSYSIQDAFPLVAGSFRLSIILKNTVSKEFTTLEKQIILPPEKDAFWVSPIILGYRVERDARLKNMKKPFTCQNFQIMPHAKKIFTPSDRLYVFFQIHNPPAEMKREGSVRIFLVGEESKIPLATEKLADLQDERNILMDFPLDGNKPGYYTLRVSLLDKEGREVLSKKEDFQIILSGSVARPWVFSKVMPLTPQTRAEIDFILAGQYAAQGNLSRARSLLERIYHQTLRLKYAYRLSEILFKQGEYEKVKDILIPFKNSSPGSFDWLVLLGRAHQALGEYAEAIQNYKEYLVRVGTNLLVLNAIGDCHALLGDRQEALKAWRKSLEFNPNQPEIKEKIKRLQKESK